MGAALSPPGCSGLLGRGPCGVPLFARPQWLALGTRSLTQLGLGSSLAACATHARGSSLPPRPKLLAAHHCRHVCFVGAGGRHGNLRLSAPLTQPARR